MPWESLEPLSFEFAFTFSGVDIGYRCDMLGRYEIWIDDDLVHTGRTLIRELRQPVFFSGLWHEIRVKSKWNGRVRLEVRRQGVLLDAYEHNLLEDPEFAHLRGRTPFYSGLLSGLAASCFVTYALLTGMSPLSATLLLAGSLLLGWSVSAWLRVRRRRRENDD